MLFKLFMTVTAMVWVLPSTAHGQLLTPRAAASTSASMTFVSEIGDTTALAPQCQSFLQDLLAEFPEPPVDLGEWAVSNPIKPTDPCAYSTLLPPSLRGEWTTYVISAEGWMSSNWNDLTSSLVADCDASYIASLGCTKLLAAGAAATATSTSATGGGATPGSGTFQNAGLPRETGMVGGAAAAVGAIAIAMLV